MAPLSLALLLSGAAAAAGPNLSAPLAAPDAGEDAAVYERCMRQARAAPEAALRFALGWQKKGGAHPAEHCEAVALIGLRRYREAATKLALLAAAMDQAPAGLRAGVLDQEGQAWLLAGEAGRAYTASGAAVALAPGDPDLLTDHAEAAGLAGHYEVALKDLDRVLQADPRRLDALLYRAAANRALKRLGPALSDADAALRLAPNSAPALLERGNIRRLEGDPAGAREDWLRVLDTAPASAEAVTAKANLAALDAAQR